MVLALLWILVPAIYGLPPVSARRERIRRALELANLQPGERFYDLGSGHGRVLIIAAKEFGVNAVGIEIGPVQCLVSRVNAIWNGVNSQVRIEMRNFYRVDLSKADVVFAYLTSKYANRLQEKFERELKSGARLVTMSFDLPGRQPAFFDRENLIFLYRK
jgi:cyclopropane fatty-acyl-phospholipid synthase-like methyltransferase